MVGGAAPLARTSSIGFAPRASTAIAAGVHATAGMPIFIMNRSARTAGGDDGAGAPANGSATRGGGAAASELPVAVLEVVTTRVDVPWDRVLSLLAACLGGHDLATIIGTVSVALPPDQSVVWAESVMRTRGQGASRLSAQFDACPHCPPARLPTCPQQYRDCTSRRGPACCFLSHEI